MYRERTEYLHLDSEYSLERGAGAAVGGGGVYY